MLSALLANLRHCLPERLAYFFNADQSHRFLGNNLLQQDHRPGRSALEIAVLICLMGVVLSLATLAMKLPLWKNQQLLDTLASHAQDLRTEAAHAQELRQEMEALVVSVTELGETRGSVRPMVDILLELTNLLSDDSWLELMEISCTDVLLRGQSKDSVALAVRLENSPMFSNIAFRSPVVTIRGSPYERFQLALRLAVEGTPNDCQP